MNKRNGVILLIAAAMVSLIAISVRILLLERPNITEAVCTRIQSGMSHGEVTKLLGAPPGDYETGRRGLVLDLYTGGVLMNEGRLEQWGGDDGFIQIGFDENDIVLWTRFVPAGRRLTLIEQWLGISLW